MQWLDRCDEWNGVLPAVLVATARDAAARRAQLVAFAAFALGRKPQDLAIRHQEGEPPHLIRPDGASLHLSSASRGEAIALALAARPIGVDVEIVEPGTAIPWNVLHGQERRLLEAAPDAERPGLFATIWSAKEAYLKARGTGLFREPASFAARFAPDGSMQILDPEMGRREIRAESIRRSLGGLSLVVSAVLF